MSDQRLSPEIDTFKDAIVSAVDPKEVWLFGSYAHDEQRLGDSPDICVVMEDDSFDRGVLANKLHAATNKEINFILYSFVE